METPNRDRFCPLNILSESVNDSGPEIGHIGLEVDVDEARGIQQRLLRRDLAGPSKQVVIQQIQRHLHARVVWQAGGVDEHPPRKRQGATMCTARVGKAWGPIHLGGGQFGGGIWWGPLHKKKGRLFVEKAGQNESHLSCLERWKTP